MHNEHTTSDPQTLLPQATVTIRFDGLIYTAYNKDQRLYQAAVHTVNEDHHLTIGVTVEEEGGKPQDVPIPKWDPEYAGIKDSAPFWLFVDSGNGLQPDEFSAQLYLPEDLNDHSFDHILNFQSLYGGRKITLDTNKFAQFNFPHGTCYSAMNTKAKLEKVDARGNPIVGKDEEIVVSRIGAVDIDLLSDEKVKREIVLMNKYNDRVFQFPLENGKHYVIDIFNQPKDPDGNGNHAGEHNGPANHFLRYYDLFELKKNEQKVMISPEQEVDLTADLNSPPCISGSGDRVRGLP